MTDTPKYTTVTEIKSALQKTGMESDIILAAIAVAAENAIDRLCNRKDGFVSLATAVVRTYLGSGKTVQRIDECTAISLVAVKDSPSDTAYVSWAASDWIPFTGSPLFPDFNSLPYTAIMTAATGNYNIFTGGKYTQRRGFRPDTEARRQVPMVQVTAKWGYSAVVPNTVRMATIAQTLRWWKRAQGSFQDSVGSMELGSLSFAAKELDRDICMMLIDARLVRPALGWGV